MKTEHSKSIAIHQICRTKLKELLTFSLKDAPANVVARRGSVVVVRNHSTVVLAVNATAVLTYQYM